MNNYYFYIKMSVPSVGLKDNGGDVELKVEDNKELQVVLEDNPTTGYT